MPYTIKSIIDRITETLKMVLKKRIQTDQICTKIITYIELPNFLVQYQMHTPITMENFISFPNRLSHANIQTYAIQ